MASGYYEYAVIDGIKFTLVEHQTEGPRQLYKLTSEKSDQIETFYVYRSQSECGLLRLCLEPHKYVKGYDYVQTPLIDVRLQNYINQCEQNVPKSSDFLTCGTKKLPYHEGDISIAGDDRTVFDPCLTVLTSCAAGYCFNSNVELLLEKITEPLDYSRYSAWTRDDRTLYEEAAIQYESILTEMLADDVYGNDISIIFKSMSQFMKSNFEIIETKKDTERPTK